MEIMTIFWLNMTLDKIFFYSKWINYKKILANKYEENSIFFKKNK